MAAKQLGLRLAALSRSPCVFVCPKERQTSAELNRCRQERDVLV